MIVLLLTFPTTTHRACLACLFRYFQDAYGAFYNVVSFISLRRIDVLQRHLPSTNRRLLSTSHSPPTSQWEHINRRCVEDHI
ncbi:hypothetical protein EDC04DRAFT_2697470 [Pisolithus marmoratus]|nr:hypothetical protein EDC04DRAFT_2697470 [Pisolithus marmoratus]